MRKQKDSQIMWNEILAKLGEGKSQNSIASELGMTRGQFRYRLRKFMELQDLAQTETAAAATKSAGRADWVEKDDIYDSLFDEFWSGIRPVDRMTLLVKDASTLFVYWNVSDLRKRMIGEHFQTAWTSLPFFLQVYDVTDIYFNGYNAHSSRRIPVHPMADSWYLHGMEPGRHYLADFGTTSLYGQFFAILRSNTVEAPPAARPQRHEPSVKFGTLHTTNGNLPWASTGPSMEFPYPKQHFTPQIAQLDEPWRDQFDGYTLSGRKGGGK